MYLYIFRKTLSRFRCLPYVSFSIKLNFLSTNSNHGLFQIKSLLCENNYSALATTVIEICDDILLDITKIDGEIISRQSSDILYKIDEISNELCLIADSANFLKAINLVYNPNTNYAINKITQYIDRMNTNENLYNKLMFAINYQSTYWNEEEIRVANLFKFELENSGVHLDFKTRMYLRKLLFKEANLSSQFFQRSLQPLSTDNLSILNKSLNSIFICSKQLKSKDFCERNIYNLSLLNKLLQTRNLIAKNTGYSNSSNRQLCNSMIKNYKQAIYFLEKASIKIMSKSKIDILKARSITMKSFENIKSLNLSNLDTKKLSYSDISFFINFARSSNHFYDVTSETQFSNILKNLSYYFSVRHCLEGINFLCQMLFDMTLEPVHSSRDELWNSDVLKAGLFHHEKGIQGIIYMDLFSRRNKSNLEFHQMIRGSRMNRNKQYQIPISAISCNFNPFRQNHYQNALLSVYNLTSFFHEMGHALHSLLGKTNFQHVSGTRCPIDMAEIPSILMEKFLGFPPFIKCFAKHLSSGNTIPDFLIRLLLSISHSFTYYDLQIQLFYGLLDIYLHSTWLPTNDSILDLINDVSVAHFPFSCKPPLSSIFKFSYFSHYGSKYYSYTWAKAVCTLIWKQKFSLNPLSRDNGKDYMVKILSNGYNIDPWEQIESFLSYKPDLNEIIHSLVENNELESNSNVKIQLINSNFNLCYKWLN